MLFSKKKQGGGPKSQQSAPALDVGMAVIQEFLNRGPGAMKARSGKSTAHILSDADGAAPNSSALLGMRLTASEKRFPGCSPNQNWSDSVRQQFVAQQQLLLVQADKSNYYSLRSPSAAADRQRAPLSSYAAQAMDGDGDGDMREKHMLSIMSDGLQMLGDALFSMFVSDIHVERRVLTQDLVCEDFAEAFAWNKIQSLEKAEVDSSRVDNAALTFAVFSEFASKCSCLVQESARAGGFVVCLGGVIPLVRMCQEPPCVSALIDSLAALVALAA